MNGLQNTMQTNQQLNPQQKAFASEAFNTAVTPLRNEFFEESMPRLTEHLAGRGISFGGLGQKAYGNALQDLTRQESTLAGNINASLLDQAFQASEAAKSRQFQSQNTGLNMGMQGLLDQGSTQNLAGQLFGQGANVKTFGQVELEQAAQAAGLSPEEFSKIKGVIGSEQMQLILSNPELFIDDPMRAQQFQVALGLISSDKVNEAAPLLDQLGIKMGKEPTMWERIFGGGDKKLNDFFAPKDGNLYTT